MLRFGKTLHPSPHSLAGPYVKVVMLAVVLLVAVWQLVPIVMGSRPERGNRADSIPAKPVPPPTPEEKRAGRVALAQAEPPAERESSPRRKAFLSEFERLTLEGIEDQRMPLEKEPFMFLLRKVAGTDAEDLESFVDSRIGYDHFAVAPDRCRGYVAKFVGTLMRVSRSSVDVSGAGLEQVWEGQVVDRFYHWYSFYVIDKPEGFVARSDVVELTGVFYKIIVYETQAGGFKATPLIIARHLKHHDRPPGRLSGPSAVAQVWHKCKARPVLYVGIGAIAAALVVLLSLLPRLRGGLASERDRIMAEKMAELDEQLKDEE